MTYFIPKGNTLDVTAENNINILDSLPLGTYAVKFSMERGYFLDRIADFTPIGKVYGNTPRHAERIYSTFQSRDKQTGVLLSGEQGSGKTMLAKELSLLAKDQGISTLVVNQGLHGESFNTFIASIDEPLVVIFDEFEKVYDREDQEKMLTLLDGLYQSKRLFILTCNDKYRVNDHIKNRPGRVFYHLEYKGLEQAFIEEYCNDMLDDTSHTPVIQSIAAVFPKFNFDMLKALVEEINRYKETPHEALAMLNAKPDTEFSQTFQVALSRHGVKVETDPTWDGAPLDGGADLSFYLPDDQEREDIANDIRQRYERMGQTISDTQVQRHVARHIQEARWDQSVHSNPEKYVTFTVEDFDRVDPQTGDFYFSNEKDFELVLSKQAVKSFSWGPVNEYAY